MSKFAVALVLAALGACAQPPSTPPQPGAFSFALIGDLPYSEREEQALRDMMREIDGADLAFVIHVGDIKSGYSRCDDAVYAWNKQVFERSRHPFVYVPGDNEWTDCHRPSNGRYDPLERLAHLRKVFYGDDQTLGRNRFTLARQSADPGFADYRENVRWVHKSVMFVGLNLPGSNNNFGRTSSGDAEYHARNAANLNWIRQAFAIAARDSLRAVVIAVQADPEFELAPGARQRRGFEDFIGELARQSAAFGQPVVLLHGDSHEFRVDRPLADPASGRPIANFMRIETFGSPVVGWVQIAIDPDGAQPITVMPFKYRYRE